MWLLDVKSTSLRLINPIPLTISHLCSIGNCVVFKYAILNGIAAPKVNECSNIPNRRTFKGQPSIK